MEFSLFLTWYETGRRNTFAVRLSAGGQFPACGTCLKLRQSDGSEMYPLSMLNDHYEIVRDSDRVLSV